MISSPPKILLTGATGYIGGSVLAQLLSSPDAAKYGPITCLVRGKDQPKILLDKFGPEKVNPVLFRDLDDAPRIIEVASQHDIVINTTLGFHPSSAKNLVLGLSKGKQETGKDVYIIHTSGTSNIADRPITKKYIDSIPAPIFSDKDDIYSYEKKRNAEQSYAQREAELTLIDTGLETGVKTLVIMSPTIYGIGSGEFNKLSIQAPMYIHATLKAGYTPVIGDGSAIWHYVHVLDLARLYQLALNKILAGDTDVPFGKQGIIFSESGQFTWKEFAQGIADAAYGAGQIGSREVRSVGIEEGARLLAGGNELNCELGLASNARNRADVAKGWGWRAEKGEQDWEGSFGVELGVVVRENVKREYPEA